MENVGYTKWYTKKLYDLTYLISFERELTVSSLTIDVTCVQNITSVKIPNSNPSNTRNIINKMADATGIKVQSAEREKRMFVLYWRIIDYTEYFLCHRHGASRTEMGEKCQLSKGTFLCLKTTCNDTALLLSLHPYICISDQISKFSI